MKKLFLTLILSLMFVSPVMPAGDGPVCVDAVYDAALAYFEIADRIFISTDGTYANRVWEATIDGDDLSPVNGATDGRALQIEAQSATASGSGLGDTAGLYDVGTTTVLCYWPVPDITYVTGDVYSFGTTSTPIVFRDIVETP